MEKLNFNEMYEIIANNDASFDGKFFYAVKTTGIYCKPSCKSKTPKKENVDFFSSIDECIKAGYRPCKRCKSNLLDYNHSKSKAETIRTLIDKLYVDSEALNKELKLINLSSKRIIEIFKQHYNTTPSNYMLKLRIEKAKEQLLKSNITIIDIAFNCGFNSLSAFYRCFKSQEKTTPTTYRKAKK